MAISHIWRIHIILAPLDFKVNLQAAFAGYYFQNTVYTERAWLVKTDSAGNVQWNKNYGPDVEYSDRYFHSFQQTSDGGFIAAGSTNEFNVVATIRCGW